MKKIIIGVLFLLLLLSACSLVHGGEPRATGIDYAVSFFDYDPPSEYVQNDISEFDISKEFIDGKWTYLDGQGKILPYSHMSSFYGELSVVSCDGRYGLANSDLELVIPMDYDVLVLGTDPKSGQLPVFYAEKDGQWSIIDTSCNQIRAMSLSCRSEPDVAFNDVAVIIIDGDVVLVEPENIIPMVAYVPLDIWQDEQNRTDQHIELVHGHFENQLMALYDGEDDFIAMSGYRFVRKDEQNETEEAYIFTRERDGQNISIVKKTKYEGIVYEIIPMTDG